MNEKQTDLKANRCLAEMGLDQAQLNLGIHLACGIGCEKNPKEAIYWIRAAADQGLAAAQCCLGDCLADGLCGEEDKTEAVKWFRAAKITATVLGLARNRKPGFEPTDLVAITEDVLLLLDREMNKYRISVEKDFHPVPEISANANQIEQVLVNLLINARQAMPQGGRLILKIAPDATGRTVEMLIRDFGTGIPADKLPKIFDSFYTTKKGPDESGKGGTGLGLSLCKRIIERHHGKVRVESTLGKGTAFTLRFPAIAEREPAKE